MDAIYLLRCDKLVGTEYRQVSEHLFPAVAYRTKEHAVDILRSHVKDWEEHGATIIEDNLSDPDAPHVRYRPCFGKAVYDCYPVQFILCDARPGDKIPVIKYE